MEEKKISIIMGVYNCEKTVSEAIESILAQTYSNWEMIICDDCSTDKTYEIICKYKTEYPNKFLVLKNNKNSRLAYCLNRCLSNVTGEYIARMDGDDISHPERFEKQVGFLDANPNIDLVGTSMQRFNTQKKLDVLPIIENPNKYTLKNKIPFNHATVLTYTRVFKNLSGYTVSERTKRSQDHDLWFRFFKEGFTGSNINRPLYYVREDSAAIRRRTFKVRFNAYKTTLIGYRMLNYPMHWYARATLRFLLKSTTPYFIVDKYRNYQSKR